MKDFLNKTWVKWVSWGCIVLGTLSLILGGTPVADIAKVPSLVFGVVEAIGLLLVFVKTLVNKKNSEEKTE